MDSFTIQPNEYLIKSIQAYYHHVYTGFRTEGNPDFINHLKNSFDNTGKNVLQEAIYELIKVLNEELPKIRDNHRTTNLFVCVVPRSKSENSYSVNQKLFKKCISVVSQKTLGLIDGSSSIIRHTNTRTTHLNNSGYGGDGEMPYPGITKATCNISSEVLGKDILLIDDIYTKDVNIDEDAIQALLDNGAKSVIFYCVGNAHRSGIKQSIQSNITSSKTDFSNDTSDDLPF